MNTAVAAVAIALAAQSAGGFVSLFNGTLDGWTVENTEAGNFRPRDGLLRVEGPSGWLRSSREYGDFTLRAEFRFVTDDADSGIFVRAIGDTVFARGWPNRSYQVQLRNPVTSSRLPPVGGLFRHGMPPGDTEFDTASVERVSKPTGEWQAIEIEVTGDRLAVRLNGTEVTRAAGLGNPRGHVGIQGETGAVEFRTIAIRER